MDQAQSPTSEQKIASQAIHRRQVFWQITFPLLILAAVFIAFIVLVSLSGAGYQSRWADISLIWCLCPNLLVLLLCVGMLGALSFGLFRLRKVLPGKLAQVQDLGTKVRDGVQKVSDAAVEPVLKVQSSRASQESLRKSLREFFRRPPQGES